MRRRVLVLAALVVLLPAADWLGCTVLQRRLGTEYAAWVKTITSQGWTVHTDAIHEGGFPAGATLTISGLDLSGGRAMLPGGLDWHADRVVLTLGLLHFWQLAVEPQGGQILRAANAKPIAFFADSLVASVPLGRGRADSLTLVAESLTAGLQASGQHQDVHIDHLALHLQANRGGAARVAASANIDALGVELPDNGRWPLGALVKHVAATIDLASPALSGIAAAEQARAWHDWGGALSLTSLLVQWGPLDLQGQARLGLDDSLQPSGKGSATIKGWEQTVDALAAGGTMPNGMAQTVKFVMGLMARAPQTDGDDGPRSLQVPFTLKNSTLSVGKIPLIKLRSFAWGGV